KEPEMSITIANTGIGGVDGVAVRVTGPSGLYFLSGINPNPIYHAEPMTDAEAHVPAGIRDQAQLMLNNLAEVLGASKLGWGSVTTGRQPSPRCRWTTWCPGVRACSWT